MGARWATLLLLAGCYRPTFPTGAACVDDGDCVNGQPCIENVCGGTASPPDPPDSPAAQPDGPPADGAPPVEIVLGDDADELRDVELLLDEPNLGDGDHLSVDDDDFSVVRFDLSSIPSSATVLGAKLTVRTFDTAATDGGTILVHRLRESWDEASATWDMRNATQAWSTPGALPPSSDAAPVATMQPGAINTDYTVDLPVELVQAWVSTPDLNFGILFVVGTTEIHVHLRSRENSPNTRLTVTYRP
jgi:hypothetical protein